MLGWISSSLAEPESATGDSLVMNVKGKDTQAVKSQLRLPLGLTRLTGMVPQNPKEHLTRVSVASWNTDLVRVGGGLFSEGELGKTKYTLHGGQSLDQVTSKCHPSNSSRFSLSHRTDPRVSGGRTCFPNGPSAIRLRQDLQTNHSLLRPSSCAPSLLLRPTRPDSTNPGIWGSSLLF